MFPVEIYQKDQKTRVDGEFFCLNFGNVKEAFLPEESNVQRRGSEYYNDIYYTMPFVPKDDDVAVSTAALNGPDIWVDPKLFKAFFISDRLQKALKKAKLDKAFRLFRCGVTAAENIERKAA